MARRLVGLVVLVLLTTLTGCQTARLVSFDSGGGVVAIPNNSSYCRKQAEELMAQRCPQGYTVVREEEVVVGQVTTADQTSSTDEYSTKVGKKKQAEVGSEITRTSFAQTTQDKTEYRITFQPK
jgi:hypothetical protein